MSYVVQIDGVLVYTRVLVDTTKNVKNELR